MSPYVVLLDLVHQRDLVELVVQLKVPVYRLALVFLFGLAEDLAELRFVLLRKRFLSS